jgi:deazaflavin-dependent oxidoreductase (nitroreductase family)
MMEKADPKRYVPAGALMKNVVNPLTVWLGGPTLTVRGRKSGRLISTPVPPFEFEGSRYFVGGRGEANWARNLRAAGEGEFRQGRRREKFRAVEVFGAEHDRVLAEYRVRLGRRVRQFFEAFPDLADHPVFRIEPRAQVT